MFLNTPDPVAFTIFNIEIRWYGILITSGILLALLLAYKRANRFNISKERLIDTFLISLPAGIIGARLYYVLFNLDYYLEKPLQILNIRAGGLAIHGGLIFGLAAAFICCKVYKISFSDLFDLVSPSIALAQSIGRWGNYFNSEAHGGATDLPFAILVDGEAVHPTFLYESVFCLLLCLFLLKISQKRQFKGQIILLYCFFYSLERFFVEYLRTDSLMFYSFKVAMLLSLVIMIISAIIYICLKRRRR